LELSGPHIELFKRKGSNIGDSSRPKKQLLQSEPADSPLLKLCTVQNQFATPFIVEGDGQGVLFMTEIVMDFYAVHL
jgi:hypothetical protein